MDIPLGLLICGGVIAIILGGIILVALVFGYILLEYAVGLALIVVGLIFAGYIVIRLLLTPIHIPFLSPAATQVPLATPSVSERDVQRSLASYGGDLELLNFAIGAGNIVEIEYRFVSSKPVANQVIKTESAHEVICALRKYIRKPLSDKLRLIGQARHEDSIFGITINRPAGELQFSASEANRVNCIR